MILHILKHEPLYLAFVGIDYPISNPYYLTTTIHTFCYSGIHQSRNIISSEFVVSVNHCETYPILYMRLTYIWLPVFFIHYRNLVPLEYPAAVSPNAPRSSTPTSVYPTLTCICYMFLWPKFRYGTNILYFRLNTDYVGITEDWILIPIKYLFSVLIFLHFYQL